MIYDQDKNRPLTSAAKRRLVHLVVLSAVLTFALVVGVVSMVGAANDGCRYTVQRGDTLSGIGRVHDVPWQRLAANNRLVNAHLIHPGDVLDVCLSNRPTLSTPVELPGRVTEWARAVHDTRPAWATDNDTRFLIAVSGPESNHGMNLWNPGDAGGAFTGSYGVVQIRVMGNPPAYPQTDWYRNQRWLGESFENQARAAWIVLEHQGVTAWGPSRDGKMPANCANSSNVTRCEGWWNIADALM